MKEPELARMMVKILVASGWWQKKQTVSTNILGL